MEGLVVHQGDEARGLLVEALVLGFTWEALAHGVAEREGEMGDVVLVGELIRS